MVSSIQNGLFTGIYRVKAIRSGKNLKEQPNGPLELQLPRPILAQGVQGDSQLNFLNFQWPSSHQTDSTNMAERYRGEQDGEIRSGNILKEISNNGRRMRLLPSQHCLECIMRLSLNFNSINGMLFRIKQIR